MHLGAALWNRGNVIVGLYGQWHGPANNDRRHVEMDLGLVVSNDGLHYSEPIPDFPMVAAAEDGMNHLPRPWNFKHAALAQGQGFENIGGETLFWYAPWPEQLSDGVRVATWQRDRLGCLQPFDRRQLQVPCGCHVISAPHRPRQRARAGVTERRRPVRVRADHRRDTGRAVPAGQRILSPRVPAAAVWPQAAGRLGRPRTRGSGGRADSHPGPTTRESAPRIRA